MWRYTENKILASNLLPFNRLQHLGRPAGSLGMGLALPMAGCSGNLGFEAIRMYIEVAGLKDASFDESRRRHRSGEIVIQTVTLYTSVVNSVTFPV